ncbi:MAG: mannosyl-glycoprotein endo-beta-N-acetylglucosamidase [Alteromonadaceae bacterium]|nr:mannosyl-glycoprotein endo-beta-N-acetylglucosamidase [Alteromonadaceae bacterium]
MTKPLWHKIALVIFWAILLWCVLYPFINLPKTSQTPIKTIETGYLDTTNALLKAGNEATFGVVFNDYEIQLVPNFSQGKPIPQFGQIPDVKSKKSTYFEYIGQMSERINQIIIIQRQFLISIQNKPSLSTTEQLAFNYLSHTYRVKNAPQPEMIKLLLHRVAPIPTPLVQIQTANESGWGTSRFARKGYNFFGLWCYQTGCGFIPKQRIEGMNHEVARFDSLAKAMYRYKLNLNRNRAYREMRDIRARQMSDDSFALSYAMIGGLKAYSERGDAYIDELRNMLEFNREFLHE